MSNADLLAHDLTYHPLYFSSDYRGVEFIELNVKFKKIYPVAPMVRVWIEAISPDISHDQFPYFALPPQNVRYDGFTLLVTNYESGKFKIHYQAFELKQVDLERGEA